MLDPAALILGCCEDRKPRFLVPQMPWCYPEVVLGCHFASASGRAYSCTTSQEVLEPVSPLHLGGPAGGACSPSPQSLGSKVGRVGGGGWSMEMSWGYCPCTLPPVPPVVLGSDPGLCELLGSALRSAPMGCPQGVRPRMVVGSLKGGSQSPLLPVPLSFTSHHLSGGARVGGFPVLPGLHCVLLGGGWGSWRGAMGVCDLPRFPSDSEEQVETVLWACVDPVELSLRLLGQSLLMDSSGF